MPKRKTGRRRDRQRPPSAPLAGWRPPIWLPILLLVASLLVLAFAAGAFRPLLPGVDHTSAIVQGAAIVAALLAGLAIGRLFTQLRQRR